MDESNTRRIVILGKTGSGKSSLANTIFGEELFTIGHTLNSETRECQAETKSVNGRSITLIDAPGFFDTERSEEEMKPEIVRCITECAPGPHAFLIVLKVERFTEHEQAVITKINQYFSEEVYKHAIVVFTHGDQLLEGNTIKDFVSQNPLVSDLVEKCGGRYHIIDNKYWKNNQQDEYRSNQFQVKELLNTIDKMIEANQESCYTNEVLQTVAKVIQQEEENIRQSSGNMSEEEIRKQARVSTGKKLRIILAGTATGVVLGAFVGVGVSVGLVVILLNALGITLATAVRAQAAVAAGKAAVAAGKAAVAAGETAVAAGETAVVAGETAVAAGETAVGAGGAAGGAAVVAVAVCAVVGAVGGGITGYYAAEGADTPQEAAKRAAKAVKDNVLFVYNEAWDMYDSVKKQKSKQS